MNSYAWRAEKFELAYGSSWTGSTSWAAISMPPLLAAAVGAAAAAAAVGAAAAAGAVVAAARQRQRRLAPLSGRWQRPEMSFGTTPVDTAAGGLLLARRRGRGLWGAGRQQPGGARAEREAAGATQELAPRQSGGQLAASVAT